MNDCLQAKLKEFFEKNVLEERTNEVLEILSKVAEECMQNNEYAMDVQFSPPIGKLSRDLRIYLFHVIISSTTI